MSEPMVAEIGEDYDEHVVHVHRRDQRPNALPHPDGTR